MNDQLLLSLVQTLPEIDTTGWSEPWRTLLGTPLNIVVTILLCLVLRWFAHRMIDRLAREAIDRHDSRLAALRGTAGRLIADATGLSNERHRQRTATTASLLRSLTTAIIGLIGLLTVLSEIGIPLAPLLASAGVGGVALGFGAQSLVRDFLSGVFMIIEDQYGVGDVVDTGQVVGTVEEVSLRITRLRDADGVIWYVRNGEIIRLGNRSQGFSVAIVDVQVSYGEDLSRISALISEAVAPMTDAEPWSDLLLEEPKVTGIESLVGGLVTTRVTAKCRANEKDGVQREIRQRVKRAFDAAGVALPVPPTVPYGFTPGAAPR